MSRGWHMTPTGKVYELYSRLAWNGDVVEYHGGDKQSYWAVTTPAGGVVITLINDSDKATRKKANVDGREMSLSAPPRSIVCFDLNGKEIERLLLSY